MGSGEFVFRGLRLGPLDDEALLVRVGGLGDNVEVDVVDELCARMRVVRAQISRDNTVIVIMGLARRIESASRV